MKCEEFILKRWNYPNTRECINLSVFLGANIAKQISTVYISHAPFGEPDVDFRCNVTASICTVSDVHIKTIHITFHNCAVFFDGGMI